MPSTQTAQAPRLINRLLSSPVLEAMTYPHKVDHYLAQLNPLWSTTEVRAVLTSVRKLTADTVTLRLRPNGNWRGFAPGQFVQLSVEIDGVRRTRCYSPANSIHARDGEIELTIKAHEWGFVSRHLRERAARGQIVTLSQADGDFALPVERPERVLLISGGSGITPVMSMLRTLVDEAHAGRITFLHYCLRAEDLIYAEELQQIAAAHSNVELIRVFTEEPGGEAQGLFNLEQLASLVPDFADAEAFLCGPPGLMAAVEEVWAQHEIGERLHLERFTAAVAAAPEGETVSGDVHFTRAERYVPNDGRSLLEQAEAAGLQPQSGCRMGICATCTCRKTSGTVRNLLTGELSSEPEQDIRICVSAPVGDVTLDI